MVTLLSRNFFCEMLLRNVLVTYERQNVCGDLPEATAFRSYDVKHERKSQLLIFLLNHGPLSLHDAPKSTGGYGASLAQKDMTLMQLARRTDTASSRQSQYTNIPQ